MSGAGEVVVTQADREALEAALCAPNWSASLAHVHTALASLTAAIEKGETQ
jgi:hypothetical protein